ncbi:MAG TPA: arylesterase [Acidobacteriota bacterium]|nr:arylesterase [Acidobacteriota bacterium]
MRRCLTAFLILLCLLSGCNKTSPSPSQKSSAQPEPALPSIVAFGDSLTAGLGLATQETYPAQLQEILKSQGYQYEVINAGVSGDTSSGGLRRLEWSLQDNPKVLILELGANDMLRGQPVDLTRKNLADIIEKAQSKKVSVVLAGMEAPTSAGPDYQLQIHNLYRDLAKKYNLPLIPFFLQGVIGVEGMIQPDGTHPTAKGAHVLAQTVFATIKPLLQK